ncbi:MAG: hypothetical protein ACK4PR_00635 [Gammaproteobacteria bacterium]
MLKLYQSRCANIVPDEAEMDLFKALDCCSINLTILFEYLLNAAKTGLQVDIVLKRYIGHRLILLNAAVWYANTRLFWLLDNDTRSVSITDITLITAILALNSKTSPFSQAMGPLQPNLIRRQEEPRSESSQVFSSSFTSTPLTMALLEQGFFSANLTQINLQSEIDSKQQHKAKCMTDCNIM